MAAHQTSGPRTLWVRWIGLTPFLLVGAFIILTAKVLNARAEFLLMRSTESSASTPAAEQPASEAVPSAASPVNTTRASDAQEPEEAAAVLPPVAIARVTLHPSGFSPAAFTRPAGPLLLAFDNRSGLRNITLRLDQVGGVRLREVALRLERLHWRVLLPLPAGSYTLTEASHPGWVCRITITAP